MQEQDEIKLKNIRSIYISLAKLLHPDTEIDPDIRKEKEEIMKKVTVAYDQKDMSTLLKLEMEWVYKETSHLEKLGDDKLQIYNEALKQQLRDLEMEKKNLRHHPKFAMVSEFGWMNENKALQNIRQEARQHNSTKEYFNKYLHVFKPPYSKKSITDFVYKTIRENEEENDDALLDLITGGF